MSTDKINAAKITARKCSWSPVVSSLQPSLRWSGIYVSCVQHIHKKMSKEEPWLSSFSRKSLLTHEKLPLNSQPAVRLVSYCFMSPAINFISPDVNLHLNATISYAVKINYFIIWLYKVRQQRSTFRFATVWFQKPG